MNDRMSMRLCTMVNVIRDTGREESILVADTGLLLGLWFICEKGVHRKFSNFELEVEADILAIETPFYLHLVI